jgi:hypothetical protein
MMKDAASKDDGVEEKLMAAVEQKETFVSDDKALNTTVAKTMELPALCAMIGEIGAYYDKSDDDEELSEDDEDEEEEEEDKN